MIQLTLSKLNAKISWFSGYHKRLGAIIFFYDKCAIKFEFEFKIFCMASDD